MSMRLDSDAFKSLLAEVKRELFDQHGGHTRILLEEYDRCKRMDKIKMLIYIIKCSSPFACVVLRMLGQHVQSVEQVFGAFNLRRDKMICDALDIPMIDDYD